LTEEHDRQAISHTVVLCSSPYLCIVTLLTATMQLLSYIVTLSVGCCRSGIQMSSFRAWC